MRKNLGLKLLALGLAIMFSYYVNNESNSTVISFIAPIEIKSLPPNKVILEPEIRQALVTVRGPSFLVSRVATSAPVSKIRLPEQLGNHYEVSLNRSLLTVPPPVEVTTIEPATLTLELDDIATKEVPVRVPRIGALTNGRKVARITVTPESVVVSGPASKLGDIQSVNTRPIDLTDLDDSYRGEVEINSPGGLFHSAVEAALVEVQIENAHPTNANSRNK